MYAYLIEENNPNVNKWPGMVYLDTAWYQPGYAWIVLGYVPGCSKLIDISYLVNIQNIIIEDTIDCTIIGSDRSN